MTRIAIYGSSGFGRELLWLAHNVAQGRPELEVLCFVDDDPARIGQVVNGVPIWSFSDLVERAPDAQVSLGIGSPTVREKLAARVAQSRMSFARLVHPGVLMSESVKVGEAAVICAGSILTTDIVLGSHVQINLGCTVGHDVVMEDFATLAPGVHVSGNVVVRRGAYVGTGAVIINGSAMQKIEIGEGSIVGAGACVTKSVPLRTTVVGVPAGPLHKTPAQPS